MQDQVSQNSDSQIYVQKTGNQNLNFAVPLNSEDPAVDSILSEHTYNNNNTLSYNTIKETDSRQYYRKPYSLHDIQQLVHSCVAPATTTSHQLGALAQATMAGPYMLFNEQCQRNSMHSKTTDGADAFQTCYSGTDEKQHLTDSKYYFSCDSKATSPQMMSNKCGSKQSAPLGRPGSGAPPYMFNQSSEKSQQTRRRSSNLIEMGTAFINPKVENILHLTQEKEQVSQQIRDPQLQISLQKSQNCSQNETQYQNFIRLDDQRENKAQGSQVSQTSKVSLAQKSEDKARKSGTNSVLTAKASTVSNAQPERVSSNADINDDLHDLSVVDVKRPRSAALVNPTYTQTALPAARQYIFPTTTQPNRQNNFVVLQPKIEEIPNSSKNPANNIFSYCKHSDDNNLQLDSDQKTLMQPHKFVQPSMGATREEAEQIDQLYLQLFNQVHVQLKSIQAEANSNQNIIHRQTAEAKTVTTTIKGQAEEKSSSFNKLSEPVIVLNESQNQSQITKQHQTQMNFNQPKSLKKNSKSNSVTKLTQQVYLNNNNKQHNVSYEYLPSQKFKSSASCSQSCKSSEFAKRNALWKHLRDIGVQQQAELQLKREQKMCTFTPNTTTSQTIPTRTSTKNSTDPTNNLNRDKIIRAHQMEQKHIYRQYLSNARKIENVEFELNRPGSGLIWRNTLTTPKGPVLHSDHRGTERQRSKLKLNLTHNQNDEANQNIKNVVHNNNQFTSSVKSTAQRIVTSPRQQQFETVKLPDRMHIVTSQDEQAQKTRLSRFLTANPTPNCNCKGDHDKRLRSGSQQSPGAFSYRIGSNSQKTESRRIRSGSSQGRKRVEKIPITQNIDTNSQDSNNQVTTVAHQSVECETQNQQINQEDKVPLEIHIEPSQKQFVVYDQNQALQFETEDRLPLQAFQSPMAITVPQTAQHQDMAMCSRYNQNPVISNVQITKKLSEPLSYQQFLKNSSQYLAERKLSSELLPHAKKKQPKSGVMRQARQQSTSRLVKGQRRITGKENRSIENHARKNVQQHSNVRQVLRDQIMML